MRPAQAYTTMPYETKTNNISLHTLKHLFTCKIRTFDIPFKSLCLSKLLQFPSRHSVSRLGRICFHVKPKGLSNFCTAWMTSMCAVYHDSKPTLLEDCFWSFNRFLGRGWNRRMAWCIWHYSTISTHYHQSGPFSRTRVLPLPQRLISDLSNITSFSSKFSFLMWGKNKQWRQSF